MDKNTVLYQLMGMRVNGVLNRIVESDADYQEIVRKSGECSDRLDALELPEEVRLLIDRYVSEQNALGARYGALASNPYRHSPFISAEIFRFSGGGNETTTFRERKA
jgi:hypothetical protein